MSLLRNLQLSSVIKKSSQGLLLSLFLIPGTSQAGSLVVLKPIVSAAPVVTVEAENNVIIRNDIQSTAPNGCIRIVSRRGQVHIDARLSLTAQSCITISAARGIKLGALTSLQTEVGGRVELVTTAGDIKSTRGDLRTGLFSARTGMGGEVKLPLATLDATDIDIYADSEIDIHRSSVSASNSLYLRTVGLRGNSKIHASGATMLRPRLGRFVAEGPNGTILLLGTDWTGESAGSDISFSARRVHGSRP